MNRILSILALLAVLALLPCAAWAQVVRMDAQHLTYDYPEDWLVLSPQLAMVYEPLLQDNGIDAGTLCTEMEEQGIVTRAYRPDFTQHMSVITRRDNLSEEIFDIASVTDEQRKRMRSRAENNTIWETTGCRTQDVEWQKEGGSYWMYIHYIKQFGGETVGRGLRYITVRNGMYVMLDWQIGSGRFGNRDLSYFRSLTHGLEVTQVLDVPMRTVTLTAQIPAETTVGTLTIKGKATAGAAITAETPLANGATHALAVTEAGANGSFTLEIPLEEEGTYDITLVASREGMLQTSMSATVAYSAKTLPVTIAGIEEGGVHTVTQKKTTISGSTLAGAQMQLVTPFGLSKKRAGNDGSFSFELSTEDAREYKYTLILDKDGFDQRRITFSLVRVMTADQEREAVRETAEKISYKNLQKNLEENQGKVMNLYGPVFEVSEGGGVYYIRMYFNKAADGTWYNPVVISAQTDMGAKEGDMITVSATVAGVFEEQDAQGETVLVPHFEMQFVDKVE